ncbi:ornithine carbamoyltransferase [Psychrilyobacter atlanticus]|uniref:ornithine carbamoyltransferase n=1 Tax=Psychrilyobacter atlanticus TaxID=271091 RepID=UPI0003FC59C6|nr:ornithine carbamoyltransferase [Psychrilyobacter atlanticus]
MKGKSFLKLLDFSTQEIKSLIKSAKDLKSDKKNNREKQNLKGKNLALIFEKDSTRTRCAFEVGAMDQGANTTYLGAVGSQIGKKESIADTARVLGGMFDGIEYRGSSQEKVEELAKYSGVPVWNGLTDEFHPTQILADFMTIEEKKGKLSDQKLVYVGDGRSNMGNSLLIGAAKMGMKFTILSPLELFPEKKLITKAKEIAMETGAVINFEMLPEKALEDADVVYTDVWLSMGEKFDIWKERIELLKDYQVNKKLMGYANEDAIFMHCLPAFHNLETEIGKKIYQEFGLEELEVSDEVFESEQSVVFDQAANRLHTIKSVLVSTLV